VAVYKKTYRPYEGALTASWRRLLVIPRYAFEDLRKSRFLTIFYILSFIYPLIAALIIYVQHNASALRLINAEGAQRLISINVSFYMGILGWQSMLALFLSAFIGPGQVSPDLSNNALSLYLARPFSRAEYVLGKMLVLIILLSLMTWVPGLLLFGLEGYLEGWDWMTEFANRVRPFLRLLDLDCGAVPVGASALGVGEVEAGGGRPDVRRLLRRRRLRGDGERHPAH
jgi:ABC-2 type transport system permease protein